MNRHSIQARVLLLQGAGWIASLLLLAGTGWLSVSEVRRHSLAQREQLVSVVGAHLDRLIAADLAQLQRLSGSPDLRLDDDGALRASARQILQRMLVVDGIAVVDADGRVHVSEPAMADAPALAADDVRSVLWHGQPVVRPGAVGGHVNVLVPLRNRGGAPAAIAVARVSSEGRPLQQALASSGAMLTTGSMRDGTVGARLTLLPWHVTLGTDVPAAEPALAAIRDTLLWVFPVLAALGALFAWGTAWSVRQPVLLLTAAAERMRSGDLTTPIPPLPDDEVGRLGAGLEHLRRSLHASLETIARHRDELEQRVVERTRDLDEAVRRLHERDAGRAQVLRRVISAQEDERRRLARELHDDACQSLAALSVSAEAAVAGLPAGPARDRLLSVKQLVDTSLADLHRVIYDLRPSVLDDLGLVPAIRWLIGHRFGQSPAVVRLEVDGFTERLPPDVETALFRVVQEALGNVDRHAHAEQVLVQLSETTDALVIEVEDDGVGFEPASVSAPGAGGRGLGLLGMRERVGLLGGTCRVESAPGHGARVIVTVPVVRESTGVE